MAQKTFKIDNFTLYNSWIYAADATDSAGTRYDLTTRPTAEVADKTFTISGIDTSTITSIALSWVSTYKTNYSGVYPPDNTRVYPGAQHSSGSVVASTGKLSGLEDVLTSDGKVTARFRYNQSLPSEYYASDSVGYGVGSCTSSITFQDITMTVTYVGNSSSVDDEGKDMWIGVDNIARRVKNMYIGVDGIAKKVKAAWIGVEGVARLFYKSSTTLLATASRYTNNGTNTTTGKELFAHNPEVGYAACVFEGTTRFSDFTKATLYVYCTGNGSSSINLETWLRSNGDNWVKYNDNLGSTYRTIFTNSSTGLHAYDITTALKNLYSADNTIVTDGLKVYFRSYNTVKIAGHANTEYQTPYILLE